MENPIADLHPVVEWIPPATREEADQAILSLSNDIGLILAQLAEDQASWCGRTGRSPADYAAWRRRALFAKVHKESQLRESKRMRSQLAAPEPGVLELLAPAREVVEVWLDGGASAGAPALDAALGVLAERVERLLGVHRAGPVARALAVVAGGGNGHGPEALVHSVSGE